MRQSFEENAAKVLNMDIDDVSPKKETSIDDMIKRLDADDQKPKTSSQGSGINPSSAKTEFKLPEGFKLEIKSKEKRSVPKSFMLTYSINQKFSEMAKECNVSENELLNTILGQIFSIDI